MIARSVYEKMHDKWSRDRELSNSERVWKARRYAMSVAVTPLYTRSADEVGAGVRCIGKPRIVNFGMIELHDHVVLRSTPLAVELATSRGGELTIGSATSINSGTSIHADRSVHIGARVSIAPFVHIMDTEFHGLAHHGRRPAARPIQIDDDVWICVKATVLPGVRIGRGSVVASHSVVTKDVPAGVVVAGVPARIIGDVPDGTRRDAAVLVDSIEASHR